MFIFLDLGYSYLHCLGSHAGVIYIYIYIYISSVGPVCASRRRRRPVVRPLSVRSFRRPSSYYLHDVAWHTFDGDLLSDSHGPPRSVNGPLRR